MPLRPEPDRRLEKHLRALKIGLVAPYDLATPGGVNNQIRSQAQALRGLGHEVTIYGPASRRISEPGEVGLGGSIALNVGGTVSGMSLNPLVAPRVSAELGRRRFDILHLHEPLTPLLPWLFQIGPAGARLGTFHVHREGRHAVYAWTWWLLRPLVNRLRYRIAVSEAALQTVRRYFPGDYEIVPNGIDVARFASTNGAKSAANGRSQRSLLFVGRIEDRKGLTHLVEAMAVVQRKLPNVRLDVVGDGPERGSCERLARLLNVNSRFYGRVSDETLPGHFHEAEVVCSPATGGESFGVILLEAMASGKPIVASNIEGYAGLLGPSEAGLLVPPADPHALAEGILRLLDDPAGAAAMGRRASEAARQFDWREIALRLEAIYRSLLAG